jgi:hypothetical protein
MKNYNLIILILKVEGFKISELLKFLVNIPIIKINQPKAFANAGFAFIN